MLPPPVTPGRSVRDGAVRPRGVDNALIWSGAAAKAVPPAAAQAATSVTPKKIRVRQPAGQEIADIPRPVLVIRRPYGDVRQCGNT
jgi:hypothetical protein